LLLAELKLYHGRVSTCSKKVRMVLYEKQLPFTICLLDLQKFEHLTPAYLRLNPNGAPRWFIAGVP
jgi:glutathione S-transferase